MLIDWFTVGAQVLNFLILIWLLKRFLYKPILHAIDEREERIAKEIANADIQKAKAQQEHDEFKHKNENFDQQRAALLNKAIDEAQSEGQRLLNEERKAAEILRSKLQQTLKDEENNLHQNIRLRTQQEVFAMTRKVLADLATANLEEHLCEVFICRLQDLDSHVKKYLTESFKTMSDPVLVRSAFDLPTEQRVTIQSMLNKTFSAEINVQFVTTPNLISGIELTTNGQKLAWSIGDYLVSMQKGLGELLEDTNKPEAETKRQPEALSL
jgi:F-type H+-transporting ATPase subunit b